MKVSLAFFDDHPILLEGLVGIYSGKEEFVVVAQGGTALDALRIAEDLKPNVIVMDLNMPGDPMAVIQFLSEKHADIRIVVFTAASSIDLAVQALKIGVSGYVLKGSQASELHQAIKAASAGETFVTPCFASKVIMALKSDEARKAAGVDARLSYREVQIVRHLMRGSTNKEIASGLSISEKTVKHYMSVLMQKLAVRNRLEVVLAAQKLILLPERSDDGGLPRFN